MMTTAEAGATGNDRVPTHTRLSSGEFWVELVIKQGIAGAIALYVVWSVVGQLRQDVATMRESLVGISLRLDKISDKLTPAR